ncbi:DUF7507 domain-containing protein [Formosa maritima]|uniref:DUF7507 domain-containing protein n=1 Tax=Formosa maritima TaxID=2592046 RepID=A0A5D0GG55_9FLAO|nr:hypothetical protein [Formosa maritima]TYA57954.1 hypothetical protein FVF61_03855 [Formosa maritima]
MKKSLYYLFCFLIISSCGNDDDATTSQSQPNENPSLEVTNTIEVTTDENNFLGVDDVLTYTISVKNTGDVTLNNINLTYNLTDNNGGSLSLDSAISFVNSDANSEDGTLLVEETANYTANYTITQSDVDAGGISNSIIANGTTPNGTEINDTSDNGNDDDGNDSNDPTVNIIEFDPLIISEYHELNSSGDIRTKYAFNEEGDFYKFSDIGANLSLIFEYDSEGKITIIEETDLLGTVLNSHEISYDTDDRVTSIGNHNYIYNTDEEFYYDEDSYFESTYEDGDLIYTEIGYLKFLISESSVNSFTDFCNYSYNSVYNTVTESYTEEYTYCNVLLDGIIGHDGINVIAEYNENDDITYVHFSSINPVYTDSNNLQMLFDFLKNLNILDNNFNYKVIWSQNNLQSSIPEIEPSSNIWSYNFNDLELPIESTIQSYYAGSLEYERLFANYYYQGDTIPD